MLTVHLRLALSGIKAYENILIGDNCVGYGGKDVWKDRVWGYYRNKVIDCVSGDLLSSI